MERKFTAEKFTHLPSGVKFAKGILAVDETEIDMVPAGLKGIKGIIFNKMPLFVAPDFNGYVIHSAAAGYAVMNDEELKEAKIRYKANKKMVEAPRYVEKEDGSLSLCSLPKNINVVLKPYAGYYLDLTQTDIVEKQTIKNFEEIILYPKRFLLTETKEPQKICSNEGFMND